MTLEVRQASAADDSRLREIRDAATKILRRTYRPSPELVTTHREDAGQWTVFVAARFSLVIGVVECRLVEGALHLRGLAVDPAHHRTRAARALIDFLVTRAETLGAKRLALYTIAETGNVAVFERLGFQVVSSNPAAGFESGTHATLQEVYMLRTVGN